MDNKKICFIICTNNNNLLNEAIYYINRLNIPDGYSIDLLTIEGAESMCAGYNEGMKASDAKYKIYMHQDVFIVNKNFLIDILEIFKNEKVGLIGMVGASKLSEDYMYTFHYDAGMYFTNSIYVTRMVSYQKDGYASDRNVKTVDGFLMATQYDIPWREDIFTKWDFYDHSQSFEFRKKGYDVVVPYQEEPWCLHYDGFLNLENYYEERRKFIKEYENSTLLLGSI